MWEIDMDLIHLKRGYHFIVLSDEEMIPSFSINIKGRRADSCESTYEKENIKITCSVLFL